MSQKTLSDALGTNLIFTRIMSQHQVPWYEDTNITGALLDFEYNYNFSGDKLIAPAVKKNLDTDGKITTAAFNNLCDVVWMMYGQKWARLWEVQTAEFDPIENYSMTEKEETKYGKVDTNSGTDSTLRTGTDTNTESGTNTLLMTGTDTHALSGKDTVKNTGTDNVVTSGSQSNVKTGSQSNVKTGSEALAMAGSEQDSHTGGYTDTNNSLATEHEVSAFNSSGYSDASKDTTSGGTTRTHNNDNVTKSFTNRTDTTTFNNVTDATTFNSVTDATTFNNVTNAETKNLQDETTYGKQDLETRNMSDATTFGHVNTESRNMTDALTHGHIVTASGKDERELTRSGNIGTTTSQMMLESSLELWKWNFFCDIFKDVDSIFALSVY